MKSIELMLAEEELNLVKLENKILLDHKDLVKIKFDEIVEKLKIAKATLHMISKQEDKKCVEISFCGLKMINQETKE